MKRALFALLLLGAACGEPAKQNRAHLYVSGLQDILSWDAQKGGRGQDVVEVLLNLEPGDSVPSLLAAMMDPTPTRIDDRIHRVPTVGDVAFHLLLLIFSMSPPEFEDEGVWVGTDPIRNPIYNVHLDSDTVRQRVRFRFLAIAQERGWVEKPDKK